MNVASLELSKELYELSGWLGTHAVWHDDTTISPLACEYEDITVAAHFTPAYDLGYLLRKIERQVAISKDDLFKLTYYEDWKALLATVNSKIFESVADTPEDATCKLAIELFKQGVLTRDDHE